MTTNVTMSFEAVSLFPFALLISCMALIPIGVAAFPSPSILALILAATSSVAMSFRQVSGKMNFKMGDMIFATIRQTPMSSSTRMTPLQSPITPTSAIVSVTAFDAPSRIAPASCDKFPVKIAKSKEIMLIIENILPKIAITALLFLYISTKFKRFIYNY